VTFLQKWIFNRDQSALLLWAPREKPPAVARIACQTVLQISGQPEIDCRSWADAEPNIEILIEIASRLFEHGRYVHEQNVRIVEICDSDLKPYHNGFRRISDVRPRFVHI
jgi:hypothetical protein